jgi:hypothetical protein
MFKGYLLNIHTRVDEENDNVLGYILDTNVSVRGSWNFPESFVLSKFGARYAPMPNNSVAIIKQESASGIWNLFSSELPRFLEGKNKF